MTMEVFDTYEGNSAEDSIADRLAAAEVATVTVTDDERRRSRFRAETDAGTEVGVVLARTLRAGDVLSTGDKDGPLLEVALEPIEALVVNLGNAAGDLTAAAALGHAAGNRHWDLAIRGGAVLFPATESDERMTASLEPHLPDGAPVEWDTVSPGLFDGGPGNGPDHDHTEDGGHVLGRHVHHDHSHDEDESAGGEDA